MGRRSQISHEEFIKALFVAPPATVFQAYCVLKGEGVGASVSPEEPLLCSIGAGAKRLGVSRTTLWRMIQSGRLDKVEIYPGSYRLRVADLKAIAAGKGGDDA
jgi:excisionase family DNA binding protein